MYSIALQPDRFLQYGCCYIFEQIMNGDNIYMPFSVS